MKQSDLFNPLQERLNALNADVEAIGGTKELAKLLYPDEGKTVKEIENVNQRIRNALNSGQNQQFKESDVFAIAMEARRKTGVSQYLIYVASKLAVELKWISDEARVEQSTKRVADAMLFLQKTIEESRDLLITYSRGVK